MVDGYNQLGVLQTVGKVAQGSLSAQDAVSAAFARAREDEGRIQAFTHLPATAPVATPGSGPLAGVAVGVKDLIDTADTPTTYGSPIFADHQPTQDAWVISRLKDLSATVLGKTVTTELAWFQPGAARNPWNSDHTPGGSSSGSAAAVASGSVPVALGTQTYGSVLRPAAYCGVVGLKPTHGSLSLRGVNPISGSLDHLGLFTRSVDDAAFVLALLLGGPGATRHAPFQVTREGVAAFPAPRIAWLRPWQAPAMETYQAALLETTAQRLIAAGAIVEAFTLPLAFDELPTIAQTICASEAAVSFGHLVQRFPDKTSQHIKTLVDKGEKITAPTYVAARAKQLELRHALPTSLAGFDAILTAPATGEAPHGLAYTGDPGLCAPWTALGTPAISLPAGFGPKGLPLGIQLVCPYGEDLKLLRIAKWCEAALGFSASIASR